MLRPSIAERSRRAKIADPALVRLAAGFSAHGISRGQHQTAGMLGAAWLRLALALGLAQRGAAEWMETTATVYDCEYDLTEAQCLPFFFFDEIY